MSASPYPILQRASGSTDAPELSNRSFTVGQWRVFPDEGCMRSSGQSRHVPPKPMRLFELLHKNRGTVVSRVDILNAVWGEKGGSDELITNYIAVLRKALGTANARLIRTIPTRGYILLNGSSKARSMWWGFGPFALLFVAITGVTLSIVQVSRSPTLSITSVRPLIGSEKIETNPAFANNGAILISSRGAADVLVDIRILDRNIAIDLQLKHHRRSIPAMSPSGDQVIYDHWSNDHCEIRIAQIPIATTQTLANCFDRSPVQFDWSPDGQWVAMAAIDENNGSTSQMFLIDPKSGAIEPLFAQDGNLQFPRFAPDSKRLLFTRATRSTETIGLGDIETGQYELFEDWLPQPAFGYDWYDGNTIVLSAVNPSLDIELAVVDLARQSTSWLGIHGIQPAVHGGEIAFVRQARKRIVQEVFPEDSPEVKPVRIHSRDRSVKARPGGGFAASSQRRGFSTIDLIDVEGNRRELFRTMGRIGTPPAWSRDGGTLATMAGPSTLVEWHSDVDDTRSTELDLVVNELAYLDAHRLVLVAERDSRTDLLLYDLTASTYRLLARDAHAPRASTGYLFFLRPGYPGVFRWDWRADALHHFVPNGVLFDSQNWDVWGNDLIARCPGRAALCAFREADQYQSPVPILATLPNAFDVSWDRMFTIELLVESQVMRAELHF